MTQRDAPASKSPTPPSDGSLLLVDDDVELCEPLHEFFTRRGYLVETAHDGRRGLGRALSGTHDLIMLDVMMPDLDGFEVLRMVRRQSQTPVIMLTARTTREDRVLGLDAGADDYPPKPFGTDELLARARGAPPGRSCAREVEVLQAGGVTIHPSAREALSEGVVVPLTTVEYDILEFLVHAAGRVVSREELTSALYRRRSTRFDRTLDMHISNLRRKLGPNGGLIRTVRSVGYLFRAGPGRGRTPRPRPGPNRRGAADAWARSSPRCWSGRWARSYCLWSPTGAFHCRCYATAPANATPCAGSARWPRTT